MPSFNAADVVGKTLTAQTPVKLKRLPADSAPDIYTVAPGQAVGTVYSWILPGENNKRLYWMFKDGKGVNYYAEHNEGTFKITALQEQGVLTTQQATTAAQQADEPIKDFIARNILKITGIAAAAFILAKVLPEFIKK